jgi:squalene-hopene/tetraprenyl-beta-curcumene cyclase
MQIRVTGAFILAIPCAAAPSAHAQDTRPDPKEVKAVLDKAVAYLKSAQGDDGSYVPKLGGPGVSAVVAAALLHARVSPEDPVLVKTFKYLEKNIKKDGGIYDQKLANYTTSVAVMALKDANAKGQYDKILKDAAAFLKKTQHTEPETDSKDVAYGGHGYDSDGRPDASNSNYAVEALLAAGLPKDDPAVQKALKFLSRCQNMPSEFNDQPYA